MIKSIYFVISESRNYFVGRFYLLTCLIISYSSIIIRYFSFGWKKRDIIYEPADEGHYAGQPGNEQRPADDGMSLVARLRFLQHIILRNVIYIFFMFWHGGDNSKVKYWYLRMIRNFFNFYLLLYMVHGWQVVLSYTHPPPPPQFFLKNF